MTISLRTLIVTLVLAAFPATAERASDARAALADIKGTLGFVPGFFAIFPEEGLPGAWDEFKNVQLNREQNQVIGQRKIGGEARAMVVTGSINRAIQYFHAISDYLAEQKSQWKAIVAFSGEPEYGVFGNLKYRGRKQFRVDVFRCTICGRLESFATRRTDD